MERVEEKKTWEIYEEGGRKENLGHARRRKRKEEDVMNVWEESQFLAKNSP